MTDNTRTTADRHKRSSPSRSESWDDLPELVATTPEYELDRSYVDYMKGQQIQMNFLGQPLSQFTDYYPEIVARRGPPIPITANEGKAFGEPGYDQDHPKEKDLRKDAVGRRAVYGEHFGMPLEGPISWEQYFQKWEDIGPHIPLPIDSALTDKELEYCRRKGYTFHESLGRGAYGGVWRCTVTEASSQPRQLACKVVDIREYKRSNQTIQDSVDEMLREGGILRGLEHENIVKVEFVFHIHDQITGFPYTRVLLFLELCEGVLSSWVRAQTENRLSEDEARPVMADVCRGLKYLHDHNVMHLDIKPKNILYITITSDDNQTKRRYKLCDFGLSRRYPPDESPMIGVAMGTKGYKAPELLDKTPSDARKADIYCLGITFLHMLVGYQKYLSCTRLLHSAEPIDHIRQVLAKYGISEDAIGLARNMINSDPRLRPTIEQVIAHQWFQGMAQSD